MPRERLSMRKIREALRLKWSKNLNHSAIGRSCGVSRETVKNYIIRANQAGLSWPLPQALDDAQLEALLFSCDPTRRIATEHLPNWPWVHQELKKRGVTRWLLWEEYRAGCPEGVGYSRFCQLFMQYQGKLDPVMRQTHPAGETLFVDYAGMTIPWCDQVTGECFEAQIFVASLGASSYTFAQASRSQKLPDWITSHVHAFRFFDGVTEVIVPDNLKSGVNKAHRYDPEINPTYQDLANHYGVAVLPARPHHPQDKGTVEINVKGVEQRVLAPLRYRQFFSIAEINAAIRPLLESYNARPFQKMPGSRLSEFQVVDQPTLKALPDQPYEYAQWKKARVGIDYHIAFEYHYYSVPHRYLKQEVDCRITKSSIQCFLKGKLIAAHPRCYRKGRAYAQIASRIRAVDTRKAYSLGQTNRPCDRAVYPSLNC